MLNSIGVTNHQMASPYFCNSSRIFPECSHIFLEQNQQTIGFKSENQLKCVFGVGGVAPPPSGGNVICMKS